MHADWVFELGEMKCILQMDGRNIHHRNGHFVNIADIGLTLIRSRVYFEESYEEAEIN